jgi:hypothetical protein
MPKKEDEKPSKREAILRDFGKVVEDKLEPLKKDLKEIKEREVQPKVRKKVLPKKMEDFYQLDGLKADILNTMNMFRPEDIQTEPGADSFQIMIESLSPDWRGRYMVEDAAEFFDLELPKGEDSWADYEWGWEAVEEEADKHADWLNERLDLPGTIWFGSFNGDWGMGYLWEKGDHPDWEEAQEEGAYFEKGVFVEVAPTAPVNKESYPAANWIKEVQTVKLLEPARKGTLDVTDVEVDGEVESIYGFNILGRPDVDTKDQHDQEPVAEEQPTDQATEVPAKDGEGAEAEPAEAEAEATDDDDLPWE